MDNPFRNKKITVLGLGLHGGGVGIVRFLAKQGAAKIVATDLKTREELKVSLDKLKEVKNVEYVLGAHRVEDFSNTDLVIKNPGIPWDNKNIQSALEKNIPVEMDSSLFFRLCPNPIIGVTGTKGKTTTATAILEILKAAGRKAIGVGIGQVSVLDKLSELEKDTVVVFELSSWRLSALGRAKLSPHIAVLTNLMPDHLNYYKTMSGYFADKQQVYLWQQPKDWLIFNADDKNFVRVAEDAKAQLIRFSATPLANGRAIYLDQEAIYWNNGVDSRKIADASEIKVRGRHNLGNLMAAAGACLAFGLTPEEVRQGLLAFRGVAHRLEFVREVGGVEYYNDTAATIPDAALSALDSFPEPIVLIAGGSDKKLDFAEYARKIVEKTKSAVFIKGAGTDKLTEAIRKLPGHGKDIFEIFDSIEAAVLRASGLAIAGDVVLLSPGAASFGVFLNEFDRGDKFKAAVNAL